MRTVSAHVKDFDPVLGSKRVAGCKADVAVEITFAFAFHRPERDKIIPGTDSSPAFIIIRVIRIVHVSIHSMK